MKKHNPRHARALRLLRTLLEVLEQFDDKDFYYLESATHDSDFLVEIKKVIALYNDLGLIKIPDYSKTLKRTKDTRASDSSAKKVDASTIHTMDYEQLKGVSQAIQIDSPSTNLDELRKQILSEIEVNKSKLKKLTVYLNKKDNMALRFGNVIISSERES